MSGVKKEDIDRPVPVAGSSKISFSQVDKVERRECECPICVEFSYQIYGYLDRYMYEKLSERSDGAYSPGLKSSYR